jgi:hypothetical protein
MSEDNSSDDLCSLAVRLIEGDIAAVWEALQQFDVDAVDWHRLVAQMSAWQRSGEFALVKRGEYILTQLEERARQCQAAAALTKTEKLCLADIKRRPGMKGDTIARRLGHKPGSAWLRRVLASLVKKGAVVKQNGYRPAE